jgi:hypothetical protein
VRETERLKIKINATVGISEFMKTVGQIYDDGGSVITAYSLNLFQTIANNNKNLETSQKPFASP